MSSESGVRYTIDANDRISSVDEGWCKFAEANGNDDLMPPNIIGQSLWTHISDATTADLYRQILARIRTGTSSSFSLRCDGPSCRRLLERSITGMPDGSVEFSTHTISAEKREPIDLLAAKPRESANLLRICSWCNRVDAGSGTDDWVEVEEATERLKLFELEELPHLTHGICNVCHTAMRQKIAVRMEPPRDSVSLGGPWIE